MRKLPTVSPWGRRHDARYNSALQAVFPDCRMRWSEKRESWLLERRAFYERLNINPAKYPADAVDTFIQQRDGYYLAGEYPPAGLPQVDKLIAYLRADVALLESVAGQDDIERAARLAMKFEERDAAKRAKAKKDNSFYETGAGQELYDVAAWDEGRRVAVPRNVNFGSNPSAAEHFGA